MLIKSEPFNQPSESSNTPTTTIRMAIWPKRHTSLIPTNDRNLLFAMCEFSGHLILVDARNFDELTEDYVLGVLDDCKLPAAQMQQVKDDLTSLFSS